MLLESGLSVNNHDRTAQDEARDGQQEGTVCVEWLPSSHGEGKRHPRVRFREDCIINGESSGDHDEYRLLNEHFPRLGKVFREVDRALLLTCVERPITCREP